jgi:DNA-binding CsgD family transcriptional regulator
MAQTLWKIIELYGRGMGTDEVAEEMGMASATVRAHLLRAMRALRAGSKLETVLIAARLGLIRL